MREIDVASGKSMLSMEEAARMLNDLIASMEYQEKSASRLISETHPRFQVSARNLLHYLVLRSKDIRPLQDFLHSYGLSSLTSSESHTLWQLLQVRRWVAGSQNTLVKSEGVVTFDQAVRIRREHLKTLLGPGPRKGLPHIMVTLSQELADDRKRLEELLHAGMTVARINCGHDDTSQWLRMIKNVRDVSQRTGKSCKIYMDLSGPRIRVLQVPVRPKTNPEGLLLSEGDVVELSDQKNDFRKSRRRRDGSIKSPARIVMQPQGLLGMIKAGERVFFDDGKFEAKVIQVQKKKTVVQITRISTRKPVLRPGKGVNLPDSDLRISSLTDEDLAALPFIARYADLIGYSFVSSPDDVRLLRQKLRESESTIPSIILKIERHAAVENLPALLLEGMRDKSFGVMIARGDLAVEIGFERLSEIQQEILWICEAAHVPVIWATQVLENMNKTGFATRSEITDAAMGGMAECVMLNKGKHVVKTVHTLVDILTRFSSHTDKKRYTFRPLSIARRFMRDHFV